MVRRGRGASGVVDRVMFSVGRRNVSLETASGFVQSVIGQSAC